MVETLLSISFTLFFFFFGNLFYICWVRLRIPGSSPIWFLLWWENWLKMHFFLSLLSWWRLFTCRIFISCSKLAVEKSQTIRQAITGYISEALIHSPSVIIFDDLDSIVSFSSESEGSQLSNSTSALVKDLTDIMDEYMVCLFF